MKRSSILFAGIFGLSQFFASAALANICYSTGPMENALQTNTASASVVVKVLNNSGSNTVAAKILVFSLNGTKNPISVDDLAVGPRSSSFVVSDISNAFQFEVQVRLDGAAKTLLGVFGKDSSDNLNPSHRVVHSELVNIPCGQFGPV